MSKRIVESFGNDLKGPRVICAAVQPEGHKLFPVHKHVKWYPNPHVQERVDREHWLRVELLWLQVMHHFHHEFVPKHETIKQSNKEEVRIHLKGRAASKYLRNRPHLHPHGLCTGVGRPVQTTSPWRPCMHSFLPP